MSQPYLERRTQVQTLRRLARSCGLGTVRDDASRKKVEDLAEAISKSAALKVAEKAEAAQALVAYQATFAPAQVAQKKPAQALQKKPAQAPDCSLFRQSNVFVVAPFFQARRSRGTSDANPTAPFRKFPENLMRE